MTRGLSMQTSACDDLHVVTADVVQQLRATDQSGVSGGRAQTFQTSEELQSVEDQTGEEGSNWSVESSASSLDGPHNVATGALQIAWSDVTNTPT